MLLRKRTLLRNQNQIKIIRHLQTKLILKHYLKPVFHASDKIYCAQFDLEFNPESDYHYLTLINFKISKRQIRLKIYIF